jgi:hypothetical protein
MSYAPTNGLAKRNSVSKSLNYKYKIILFDGDKHDRALLDLALRSALPNAGVLDASSAVEVAHHVSAGPVDAIGANPVARLGEVISITLDIRKRAIQLVYAGYLAVKDRYHRNVRSGMIELLVRHALGNLSVVLGAHAPHARVGTSRT